MGGWNATQSMAGTGTYSLASWLFLRVLGVIYFVAFVSLATQVRGLIGSKGLLPARELLAGRNHWGIARFARWPTLFWISSSDRALVMVSWGGAALAILLVIGLAALPVLGLLWAFYLSMFTAGRIFLCYQWDILLLEAGFLAVLIAPVELLPHWVPSRAPPPVAIWLFWWLLFRLMFWSGAVKVRSGDPGWRKGTALQKHYETQPLPTRLAWYAHQLPAWFHRSCVAIVLAVELVCPFLIFFPGPARYTAAGSFLVLMLAIQLTGNYSFFNLLGAALCLLLFDDRALGPLLGMISSRAEPHSLAPATLSIVCSWVVATIVLLLSLESTMLLARRQVKWQGGLAMLFDRLEPFHLVNSYGLFAMMTTWRPEIILEGSVDGVSWHAYEFKWKPGEVHRAPRFVAPHQPRLDWQMWFLALGAGPNASWFQRLRERLIDGEPAVLQLFRTNPFAEGPPRFVRGVYYDYRFSTRSERKKSGAWWQRERRGLFEG